MPDTPKTISPNISVAVFAWNEEAIIEKALRSLFTQSLFPTLLTRGIAAEIVCVVNGSSDATASLSRKFFEQEMPTLAGGECAQGRVVEISQPGKLNAWNRYVHEFAAPEAKFFILMDADITMLTPNTLANMVTALEQHPEARVSVDLPRKSIEFKPKKSLIDRLSLGGSGITRSATAQLCAQLYCIRSEVARAIYIPRDLGACEDGYIKALVCTDFLSKPSNPERIRLAPDAEHSFEAYTTARELVKNQKRQVIGQTLLHLLLDKYCAQLSKASLSRLAETLRARDTEEPGWLKREVANHLAKTKFFWRVCPGYVATPLTRCWRLPLARRVSRLPSAMIQWLLALGGSFLAWKALRKGHTAYWPKAARVVARTAPSTAASSLTEVHST